MAGLAALRGARRHPMTIAAGALAALVWPVSMIAPGAAAELVRIQPAQSKAQTTFEGLYGATVDVLRAQHPDLSEDLDHVPDDHAEIARLGTLLRNEVEAIVAGAAVRRETPDIRR